MREFDTAGRATIRAHERNTRLNSTGTRVVRNVAQESPVIGLGLAIRFFEFDAAIAGIARVKALIRL